MEEKDRIKIMFNLKLQSSEEIILALQNNYGVKQSGILEIARLSFNELESRGFGGKDFERLKSLYFANYDKQQS